MKRFALLVVFAVTLTAVFAQTQSAPTAPAKRTPPTPSEMAQRQVDQLTKRLSLTSAQQAQALTIFSNAATAEAALRANLKAAHDALRTAVTSNNQTAIDQNAATIGNLEAQSVGSRAKAEAALYQILTPEQQSKFSQGPGPGPGMRDRGRGGPMGFHHVWPTEPQQ